MEDLGEVQHFTKQWGPHAHGATRVTHELVGKTPEGRTRTCSQTSGFWSYPLHLVCLASDKPHTTMRAVNPSSLNPEASQAPPVRC